MSIQAHLASITLSGHRPKTIAARRQVLTQLATCLPSKALDKATRADLELFLARPLKSTSRKAYLGHLRGYYRWALDRGLIDADPTAKIPSIRVARGTPRPIDGADLGVAMREASPRMRTWLLLMALAGLRCCEVARLRPSDLIETEGIALLYLRETKGGGTATVPAHPAILEALLQQRITDGLWWRVSPNTISRQVAEHLRSLGINATAHQLRHRAGTDWYRASGNDLLVTADLLRHATVVSAQGYTQLDPRRPAEVVRLVPAPAA